MTHLVLVGLLAVLMTACGDGQEGATTATEPLEVTGEVTGTTEPTASPTGEPARSGDQEVLVQGFRFQPDSLRVAAGTTVTWTNEDQIGHTVTAGTPEAPESAFDLELGAPPSTVEHTFTEPGTYPYYCRFHESMRGEVIVE